MSPPIASTSRRAQATAGGHSDAAKTSGSIAVAMVMAADRTTSSNHKSSDPMMTRPATSAATAPGRLLVDATAIESPRRVVASDVALPEASIVHSSSVAVTAMPTMPAPAAPSRTATGSRSRTVRHSSPSEPCSVAWRIPAMNASRATGAATAKRRCSRARNHALVTGGVVECSSTPPTSPSSQVAAPTNQADSVLKIAAATAPPSPPSPQIGANGPQPCACTISAASCPSGRRS